MYTKRQTNIKGDLLYCWSSWQLSQCLYWWN